MCRAVNKLKTKNQIAKHKEDTRLTANKRKDILMLKQFLDLKIFFWRNTFSFSVNFIRNSKQCYLP